MRVALAQMNPTVGDIAGNAARIIDAIRQAQEQGADLLLTSELALIGYPPRDLLFREGVVEACEAAMVEIAAATGVSTEHGSAAKPARAVAPGARAANGIVALVGYPRRDHEGTRPFRNSVAICRDGRVDGVYDKRLLPGYDVFDEDRYFYPGDHPCVIDVHGVRVGVLICEDLWRAHDVQTERRYRVNPVADTAKLGCDLIACPNASPFIRGKWLRHVQQVREVVAECSVPLVSVNQAGANDDLVFDGRSIAVSKGGELLSVLNGFDADVRVVDVPTSNSPSRHAPNANSKVVEHWTDWRRETWHALVCGVRDYWRKTGNQNAVIGLSGGIDSALAAVIASAALGPQHVTGVMMPSRYSSDGSIADSQALAANLSLRACIQAPIHDLHEDVRRSLLPHTKDSLEGVADENLQARLRGLLLMAWTNATGGLLLSTSNKSEMAVGYSTLYGDMCGAVAVLGDMTKTRIYELCRWINQRHAELGFAKPPIPQPSIDKAPSAELRPNQTDQDSLPPYDVLDQIVERHIEAEQSVERIVRETGLDQCLVRRWTTAIDHAQYKRNQAPVVIKVSPRAFGPGRPMPIVMK